MGNGAHALIQTLINAGVDTCFTNPGTSEMHFVAALDDADMRGVLCLFEGVASGAADGYARIAGKPAAQALEKAGIECNYNTVPFDPRKPFDPSGIRIGTPAVTSCGMKEPEMWKIAEWIQRALARPDDEASLQQIRGEVTEARKTFPAPGIAF